MTEEKKPDEKPEDKKPDTIEVEVYGEKIHLPLEQAKAIVNKRDERHSVFKDLADKVKTYETQIADVKRLAEAKEAALQGKLAESEALFSQKANEKLSNIQNHLINKEIESVLLSDETFIKDSKDDAIKILKNDMHFKISDDGTTILAGDKPAADQIKEWIKNKPIFKRATGVPPTGGKVIPGNKQKVAGPVNLSSALGKYLNKK